MSTCAGEACTRVATRECDYDLGMMCGAPLCDGCNHVGSPLLSGGTHMNSVMAADQAFARRTERTARALEQVAGYENLPRALAFAIADPGAFTNRLQFKPGEHEGIPEWGARACVIVLEHLSPAPLPRAPWGAPVAEVDPWAVDPLAVDLAGHGAVGMVLLPVGVEALSKIAKGYVKAYGDDVFMRQHGRNLVFTKHEARTLSPSTKDGDPDG